MLLPHNALVAVADGEKLNLYRNSGNEQAPALVAVPVEVKVGDNYGSGTRHHSSAANPDDSQLREDSFAADIAAMLNQRALGNEFDALVVIAAPRTLGELRQHWHKALLARLVAELAKDLTGHGIDDVEAAIARA